MNKWQREQQEKLKAVRTPSYEDEQQAKIWAAAYQAAVDTLKSFLKEDQHRLVRTLNKNEMGQLVHAITGAYAATRAELLTYELEHADELRERALKELDIFG